MTPSFREIYFLTAFWATVHAGAQVKPAPPASMQAEEMMNLSVAGKVVSVDPPNREITIMGPLRNIVTMAVDRRVESLEQFQTGDNVTAQCLVATAADVREPTPSDRGVPYVVLEQRMKAPPGSNPAKGGLRVIRVLGTVEDLDRAGKVVTVKGPRGNSFTTGVKSSEILEKLQVGQTVIFTYTEGLVVKLEKQTSGKIQKTNKP
jgi:hypothetical protein